MPLYLVRHGETDWNREGRFQSRTDVPLNARGIAQAEAIRAELDDRKVRFNLAVCSPLGRAQHTARIILAGKGLDAVVVPAFTEVEFGGFEGQRGVDLQEQYGPAYTAWRESQYTQVGPAGGESILTAAERVRGPLMGLVEASAKGNVLVVAHQAINMAMKVVLSGATDVATAATFRQSNAQVDIWDMTAGQRLEQFSVE